MRQSRADWLERWRTSEIGEPPNGFWTAPGRRRLLRPDPAKGSDPAKVVAVAAVRGTGRGGCRV